MRAAICTVLVGALLLAIGLAALGSVEQVVVSLAVAVALLLILATCIAVAVLYAMRAGWRHIQAARARDEALDAYEAEFTHITDEYVSRLADSYLTPEDYS